MNKLLIIAFIATASIFCINELAESRKQALIRTEQAVLATIEAEIAKEVSTYWIPQNEAEIDLLADAIYWAENSKKYPYGIMSVTCKGEKDCRKICINTIKNQKKRYKRSTNKRDSSYLKSLARRYAPIGVDNDPRGLNHNWLSNVMYFLNNPKEPK